METTKFEMTFALRYAIRVLERHCRMWRNVDGAARVCALLAGSGAIAALGAQHIGWVLLFGVLFAFMQALEYGLRPAGRAAASIAQRKLYAALLAEADRLEEGDLKSAIERLRIEDEIIVSDTLRRLAYNDVVRERGLDESACYEKTAAMRAAAVIA